ncbi:MAG: lytic transglycosylase domain-containing protein [Acutalibacteraceae bacterium]
MKFIKRLAALLIILIAAAAAVISYIKIQTVIYPDGYSEFVEKYADEYGVDRDLVYAVIKCESSFDPDAVSKVGAIGLMQLTPETFDWVQTKLGDESYSQEDLYDPEINIRHGVYLLKLHLAEFGDVKTALCAYHAGRGIVNKWLNDSAYSSDGKTISATPYKETNAYNERVMKIRDKYEFLHNNSYIKRLRDAGLI